MTRIAFIALLALLPCHALAQQTSIKMGGVDIKIMQNVLRGQRNEQADKFAQCAAIGQDMVNEIAELKKRLSLVPSYPIDPSCEHC